jgi:hypothetical protein
LPFKGEGFQERPAPLARYLFGQVGDHGLSRLRAQVGGLALDQDQQSAGLPGSPSGQTAQHFVA